MGADPSVWTPPWVHWSVWSRPVADLGGHSFVSDQSQDTAAAWMWPPWPGGVRDMTQRCPCRVGALHRHWASPYLVAEKPATAPCWQLVFASGITFTEKIEGKAIAKYIVPVTVTEMTLGLARLQSSCYGVPPVPQLMLLLL